MEKIPFVTKEQVEEIVKKYPTPFHIYDEKGIRENARKLKQAFSWNKGFKEYFAVKATPNPSIIKILHEEGCGTDCSSMAELVLSDKLGIRGNDIMFSSNDTPDEEFASPAAVSNWDFAAVASATALSFVFSLFYLIKDFEKFKRNFIEEIQTYFFARDFPVCTIIVLPAFFAK